MQNITPENMKEKLKPFFIKLPPLQKNYCEKCLGLMGAQFDTDNLDYNLMDTGVCDKCGIVKDVINPLIYTVASLGKLSILGKSPRIFREDRKLDISHKQRQVEEELSKCENKINKKILIKSN